MEDKIKALDNLEKSIQNTIASVATIGGFSQGPSLLNELTLINPNGLETGDNISEKKEDIDEKSTK